MRLLGVWGGRCTHPRVLAAREGHGGLDLPSKTGHAALRPWASPASPLSFLMGFVGVRPSEQHPAPRRRSVKSAFTVTLH